ncbi:MOSC domain-containing protein [Shimia gijangensis]|uniref:MOSC domain-containing protein n=1 Tax=Shimia gijangensis TaxID=1470563 RepID=A0A1M6IFR8_9RHOB|nr:MOSC domain-containing protein [Shimia gijangensis]SHJ33314.1 MOSC domain-containing protein [Shimia gijangensis]
MPALMPTEYYAEVLFLGRVIDSAEDLRAESLDEMDLGFEGISEDGHSGLTRASCSRVKAQYPRGTEIANTRQVSILSAEELEEISDTLGIDEFDPAWIGASIILRGIPDFTHVPPSSRLQADSGATIVVDMENRPCVLPARVIEKEAPGHGKGFKAASTDKRGVTGWIEREGVIRVGDVLRLHIPDQRLWSEFETARAAAAKLAALTQ